MPRSQQPQGGEALMAAKVLAKGPDAVVLDVGAGDGKWSFLRGQVGKVVALEVWQPYIDRFGLKDKYDEVICANVKDIEDFTPYDILIFGDILEHLVYADAVEVSKRIKEQGVTAVLSIPISLCEQTEVDGNPYEAHLYQWTDDELKALGWKHLHTGTNPNGLVKIGTYIINE